MIYFINVQNLFIRLYTQVCNLWQPKHLLVLRKSSLVGEGFERQGSQRIHGPILARVYDLHGFGKGLREQFTSAALTTNEITRCCKELLHQKRSTQTHSHTLERTKETSYFADTHIASTLVPQVKLCSCVGNL